MDRQLEELIESESFLWVFDRLPKKMKVIVDLKMTGQSVKEIAKLLNIAEVTVYQHLEKAKKRFLRGENVI